MSLIPPTIWNEGLHSGSSFLNSFLIKKLPQNLLDEVKISVDEIQNNFQNAFPINEKLEGQIDKEYATFLTPPLIEYIKSLTEQYHIESPHYLNSLERLFGNTLPPLSYRGEAWVNFQEKYEYNPIHHHSGVFSFVIWYQIPYHRENELKYGAGKFKKLHTNRNGCFEFHSIEGNDIISLPLHVDKSKEGYMVIFPSSLSHSVNPFYTSDDYRITVSGNIHLTNILYK